jgi:glucose/arabinose dehydrogenase
LRLIFALIVVVSASNLLISAQELSPCPDRPHSINQPWVDGSLYCLEEAVPNGDAGELSFTALAASPDGTLYAARPRFGEVLALTDTDNDRLPDTPRVVASELTLPNGLTYYRDALYISGGSHVYRLVGDTLEILVDDLPSGAGFWTGGLTVGPDERLYVATGAPCDFCVPSNTGRGAILSFALDGSDRRIIARGLRQPSDLAFIRETLWTVDTARDSLFDSPDLDELNRVTPGAHFGFPYCIGYDNLTDLMSAEFDCMNATAPALAFPTHSTPLGIAAYTSDTFPWLTGKLLVVLGGSYNQGTIRGFSVVTVSFGEAGDPVSYEEMIPYVDRHPGYQGPNEQEIHYNGPGFWPHRPLDAAVSAEGWVYISVAGGRILALRPR